MTYQKIEMIRKQIESIDESEVGAEMGEDAWILEQKVNKIITPLLALCDEVEALKKEITP